MYEGKSNKAELIRCLPFHMMRIFYYHNLTNKFTIPAIRFYYKNIHTNIVMVKQCHKYKKYIDERK